jgi:hypothetical protein
MPKIIEFFEQSSIKTDWKTQYIRYRLGRLKHQYWLWNRKKQDHVLVDEYDQLIIDNCRPGRSVFFASSGYYLKDIYEGIDVIEMHPIVKNFYPDVYICEDRSKINKDYPYKADNFAVVNNRGEHWVTINGLTDHFKNYAKIMNPGCRVFYSFRDTQIHVNRLTIDMEQHFLSWAKDLEKTHDLKLVWYDINFKKKLPDLNGYYDQLENPDTTNGNLKFWFVYKGEAWKIKS